MAKRKIKRYEPSPAPGIKMDKKSIEKIFELFEKSNKNPKIELNFSNNFTLLLAIILSAQTSDKQVNKVTESLFRVASLPEDFINLGPEKIENLIRGIGIYRNKAKNLFLTSKKIRDEYGGEVPTAMEDLIKLPGVGRKTANVWLNTVFGAATIAVDTHVLRVSKRLGLTDGSTPESVEKQLVSAVPGHYHNRVSNWLVLHGRYICKAKNPMCGKCFLMNFCEYFKYNSSKL